MFPPASQQICGTCPQRMLHFWLQLRPPRLPKSSAAAAARKAIRGPPQTCAAPALLLCVPAQSTLRLQSDGSTRHAKWGRPSRSTLARGISCAYQHYRDGSHLWAHQRMGRFVSALTLAPAACFLPHNTTPRGREATPYRVCAAIYAATDSRHASSQYAEPSRSFRTSGQPGARPPMPHVS